MADEDQANAMQPPALSGGDSASWLQLGLLTAALLLIFVIFAASIGVKRAMQTADSNAAVRAALAERGVPESEWESDERIGSPWNDGWKAATAFASVDNRETMARQTAIVGTAALGMTLVIILGGIDLSVGSVIALASVVTARVLADERDALGGGTDVQIATSVIVWAAVAGAAAGAICGLINGGLITGLRMMPFIVTLGMLGAVRGAAKGVGGNQKVDAPQTWLNEVLASGGQHKYWYWADHMPGLRWGVYVSRWAALATIAGGVVWIGSSLWRRMRGRAGRRIALMMVLLCVGAALLWLWWGAHYWPMGVWVMLWLAAAVAVMLRYTKLGRHIFAIGSNEQTARLCGVNITRVKLIVYSLMGFFAGVAGVMQFSRLSGVGDPTVAVGKELDVIAAVVIGGGSLSGGEGSIAGALIGALIMTIIRSGCTQLGIADHVQEILTGAIIVAAVALDRLRHRRAG